MLGLPSLLSLHRPCMDVWKSGEEMQTKDVQQGNVWFGIVIGDMDRKGNFLDERGDPGVRVEEVRG